MTELGTARVGPLRADDHLRGADGAPIVIVYADFTCPRCAVAHVRLGDAPVRRAFRHFALRAKHARAIPLAQAAEAAAAQDAFWPFHDAMYADQGRLEDPHLWRLAAELGLDLERFEADRRSELVAARVRRDTREALRAGAMATPTLVLPDGRLHAGAPDPGLLASLAA